AARREHGSGPAGDLADPHRVAAVPQIRGALQRDHPAAVGARRGRAAPVGPQSL
ncbi:MAG: hypothetical protein AVDCRST_MAG77-1414, partial [uncultured Chloroflexi bacterium]